ncbi:MAG: hypothetical protein ACI9JN_002639 [Bacteroidia bacterium]|jgi:hypothetical protein
MLQAAMLGCVFLIFLSFSQYSFVATEGFVAQIG